MIKKFTKMQQHRIRLGDNLPAKPEGDNDGRIS